MRDSVYNSIVFRIRTDDSGEQPYSQTEIMDKLSDGTVTFSNTSGGDITMCDSLKNDKIMAVCETKHHQDKFYAHKIGKEIYITSRRQIVHGEYFIRMNEIYRYDEKEGRVNSNPIIGTTDFYFGYENVGKDEEGKTIANQIGGGNGVLVNAPMISGVPRALRDAFERGEHIYEVEVEYFGDGETIKTVTPV